MSFSTILKSAMKKVPPIRALMSEGVRASYRDRADSALNPHKLDLMDLAIPSNKLSSLADLGGVWGVNGGYTFYALDVYNLQHAVLVDTHPTDIVLERSKQYPQLRFIRGNFGDPRVAQAVGQVDAILFFDVLLHQVAPNWDQILEMYAPLARCLIIFNPQWVRPGPTVRLLELGEDEYFENVPHDRHEQPYAGLFQRLDQEHPDHSGLWKDVHYIWQWGITDADLQAKANSLGFRMQYSKNHGPFGNLKNFENHAFVFTK